LKLNFVGLACDDGQIRAELGSHMLDLLFVRPSFKARHRRSGDKPEHDGWLDRRIESHRREYCAGDAGQQVGLGLAYGHEASYERELLRPLHPWSISEVAKGLRAMVSQGARGHVGWGFAARQRLIDLDARDVSGSSTGII
jgi:hypothetical protein